ncbi:hypothetical protein FD755_024258, partial [Muntiacus reevesi]
NQKRYSVSLLIFCLVDLFIGVSGVLKSPNIIALLSCFCIHSTSLCLLVGAFNPLTLKVIIDKYDPIAIYFFSTITSSNIFSCPFFLSSSGTPMIQMLGHLMLSQSSCLLIFPASVFWCSQVLDLSLLFLHPYTTDGKTSRLMVKKFSTVRDTQKGSQSSRGVPSFLLISCFLCLHISSGSNFHPEARGQMHPTPVLLPGKSHGRRSLPCIYIQPYRFAGISQCFSKCPNGHLILQFFLYFVNYLAFSSYSAGTVSCLSSLQCPETEVKNQFYVLEEDITEKKITKRPSEQPLPYVAPLSPKQPKIIVPASKEEVLPSEEDGMAKEEKLSEESKKSPPTANSLSPARKNPISTHTPVSMNDSQSMPCTSSPKVVETKSSIKSSQLEVEFEMQRESEAPSYIAVPDPSVLKQGFSKDPATWSVDEVIQFMKHKDPQKSGPLAELFRQHEIDGKALLLLKSDVIMKYMGLKLGPALKLCYYIEKLKEGKYN